MVATLLTGFSYEVPGVAAAGLAAERLGRRPTLAAAFLQGDPPAGWRWPFYGGGRR